MKAHYLSRYWRNCQAKNAEVFSLTSGSFVGRIGVLWLALLTNCSRIGHNSGQGLHLPEVLATSATDAQSAKLLIFTKDNIDQYQF